MLFADIRSYVQGSISNGLWYPGNNGRLKTLHKQSADAAIFYKLCYEATDCFRTSSVVQGRRLLSKAFSLLKPLLGEEEPRLLEKLIDMMVYLKQIGYVDICAMIQNHIAELARTILHEKPLWRRICISLCYPDPDHKELLIQSWHSLTDAFEYVPGVGKRLSHESVTSETNLYHRLYRSTEPRRVEKLLRGLIERYEWEMQKPDTTLLYLVNMLSDILHTQRRYVEKELLVEDALSRARDAGCLSRAHEATLTESIALVQYELWKDDLAETSMRNAMALYADEYGEDHSVVMGCSRILEGWLRKWGRDADADQMSAEIDELIGPDDIDMDAAVPSHYSAEMATSQPPNPSLNNPI